MSCKFTFHCAMLKDTLTELHQASDVDIVRKVTLRVYAKGQF